MYKRPQGGLEKGYPVIMGKCHALLVIWWMPRTLDPPPPPNHVRQPEFHVIRTSEFYQTNSTEASKDHAPVAISSLLYVSLCYETHIFNLQSKRAHLTPTRWSCSETTENSPLRDQQLHNILWRTVPPRVHLLRVTKPLFTQGSPQVFQGYPQLTVI